MHIALLLMVLLMSPMGGCGDRNATVPVGGMAFPVIPLANLTDGTALLPHALRGKVLVINFWATWCEPCRKEMPSLERLHRQTDPAKLAVLGISVDSDRNLAREFLLQHRLTFTNYSDGEQKLARGALNIQAFPVTFIVAPDGTLKARITGVRDWASADTLHMLEQTVATSLTIR